MAVVVSGPRVGVDGKFFRLGSRKFYVKGVSYGPFEPDSSGSMFASPELTATDLARIRDLGANLIRVYQPPPKWLMDLALSLDLRVLLDVPWNKQLRFMDSAPERANARELVRRAVVSCGRHPALFALSVANEIPADLVRWSGAKAVAAFIDELVANAKELDPELLCTYTSFPPTEFLRPQSIDFVCFNIYLHQRPAFKNYLARLQMQSDSKPLLLGETGIDSLREGEESKCEMLAWQVEESFRAGLAGSIVYSFTDDWWNGGRRIDDWQMGLTTAERQPKPSFFAVQKAFQNAPFFPLPRQPKVSVVVAAYNADRTLRACLDSLLRLNYPDYEVILVDDGSKDSTRQVASAYEKVRYLRHETNLGLSVARNTGIGAASGEIIAFTDADCRADEDWLYYLIGALLETDFAGVGGPNLLPPEDSAVAAAVMVSPGGPAHVMLTDRQAEHIPGCNMAFYKSALLAIDGFDPIFKKAGDDVDVCWRLQQAGFKIGFSPAAFVWHYRRSTVAAYLTQQKGYGEAEAMLVRKHPEYFNPFGGSVWRGRIYTSSKFGVLLRPPVIYHGFFASAGFQFLYSTQPSVSLMLCTSLEYHILATLPLWIMSVHFHYLLPLALASSLISCGVCIAAGLQAALPSNKVRPWSRLLVALLFFLQPIVRGLARYQGRLAAPPTPLAVQQSLDSVALRHSSRSLGQVCYWAEDGTDRLTWVASVISGLEKNGWPYRPDIGWSDFDAEIYGSRWSSLRLVTVAEEHGQNKRMLCSRLSGRWSLQARVVFWTLCGLQLLVLGLLGPSFKWLWLILISLPLLAWLLQREKRSLQSVIIVFLDDLAKELNLTKVTAQSQRPAAPAPTQPDPKSPFRAPASAKSS
jgi:glycosyltransferase involved in cell wall biosynthesis